MRDRLVELMQKRSCFHAKCRNSCGKCDGIPINDDDIGELADHLLANGVVVPPCKVEDTVYMITPTGNIRNLTILGIDVELEEKENKMTCLAVYEFEGKPCYMQIQSFNFGKTVFLTRGEAERALGGGE